MNSSFSLTLHPFKKENNQNLARALVPPTKKSLPSLSAQLVRRGYSAFRMPGFLRIPVNGSECPGETFACYSA